MFFTAGFNEGPFVIEITAHHCSSWVTESR
jgi:hypothetical protein